MTATISEDLSKVLKYIQIYRRSAYCIKTVEILKREFHQSIDWWFGGILSVSRPEPAWCSQKRTDRGVACNPEHATGLLTGGVGAPFDNFF